MALAEYRFFVDWGDDGYRHPQSAIPPEHVLRYDLDWGSTLSPVGPDVGLKVAGTGTLTLFDEAGTYFKPGTLTTLQQRLPHRWKLEIGGRRQRSGRCAPLLSDPLGTDVQPTTWALEGPYTAQLLEDEGYEAADTATTVALLLFDIAVQSGITTSGISRIPILPSAVQWFGPWAGLFNAIGNLIGAWPVERGDGAITVISPTTLIGIGDPYEFDESIGIDRDRSGVGVQTALVRTRATLPNPAGAGDPVVAVFGNEERYGRRSLVLQPWFNPSKATAQDVFRAMAHRQMPYEYVQLVIDDSDDDVAEANVTAQNLVPGRICRGRIPTPTGVRSITFAALRVRLRGGHGMVPERMLAGLGVEAINDTFGEIMVTAEETTATAHVPTVPDDAKRFWRVGSTASGSYDADAYSEDVAITGLAPDTAYTFEVDTANTFNSGNQRHAPFRTKAAAPPPPAPSPKTQLLGILKASYDLPHRDGSAVVTPVSWTRPFPQSFGFVLVPGQLWLWLDDSAARSRGRIAVYLSRPLPFGLPASDLIDVNPTFAENNDDRQLLGTIKMLGHTIDVDTADWPESTFVTADAYRASDPYESARFDTTALYQALVAADNASSNLTVELNLDLVGLVS